jgi:large subunit ribosomal protein L9
MKIILNQDVVNLGEMGDIKDVADGYARNFLFPRKFALPHNARTITLFEKRKAEIEAHKAEKRQASSSLRERIEAEEMSFAMPAGANGKLFGAVTSQSIYDELVRKGITIDRKKIEIADKALKAIGNYKVTIHLYEKDTATLKVVVSAQEVKKSEPRSEPHRGRRHEPSVAVASEAAAAAPEAQSEAPAEAEAGERKTE